MKQWEASKQDRTLVFLLAISPEHLTLSLPLATVVDTVTVPLATKVDRTPSVPLAMIVAVLYETLGKQPVFKFLPPETRHWEPENRQRKS